MEEVYGNWTTDKEIYLENLRINCIIYQQAHKKRYFYLKGILQYFKLPIIIISAINSVFISGASSYLDQQIITTTSCILALLCGALGSIELYLGVNAQMTNDMESQKEYYILAMNIFKMLSLRSVNRNVEGDVFLNDCFNDYIKLVENSSLLKKQLINKLAPLPIDIPITPNSSKDLIDGL